MKKLFYQLACSRSMAKIFSTDAQLERRNRVIFFAVLALLAFVSLGAFVFPHVGHAQECVWDCDLGSDIFDNPWGNSPQSQLDLAYCIDRDCVIRNLTPILGPIPSANTSVGLDISPISPPNSCTNGGNSDVTISGPVVAWLRDASGNVVPGSAAQASLLIKIKCVTFAGGTGATTLKRAVVPKEPRTNVFDASSKITIFAAGQSPITPTPDSLKNPSGWTGCPTNNKGILTGNCAFPLGIVEFNNNTAIARELPAAPPFLQGEVFRAEELTRFVGIRDCKGPADPTPVPTDPTTIQCSVGGGQSLALLFLAGNWSGANSHTFNPKSGSNPYDIDISILPPGISILPNTVLASANGGNPISPTGCNEIPSQNVERCFFNASDLNVVCKTGEDVKLLVTGQLEDGRKFESTDPQLTCSSK
jgi:hypothetical protein